MRPYRRGDSICSTACNSCIIAMHRLVRRNNQRSFRDRLARTSCGVILTEIGFNIFRRIFNLHLWWFVFERFRFTAPESSVYPKLKPVIIYYWLLQQTHRLLTSLPISSWWNILTRACPQNLSATVTQNNFLFIGIWKLSPTYLVSIKHWERIIKAKRADWWLHFSSRSRTTLRATLQATSE